MKTLDALDVDILSALQGDGRARMADISERIGLSASP
jgi:DNA-binding Lrp family transcriptional regulator